LFLNGAGGEKADSAFFLHRGRLHVSCLLGCGRARRSAAVFARGETLSLLALLNPSKAFLAMSTVLAGYCLFRFYAYTAGNQLVVPYLLAAGALLAMADSAWCVIFANAAENGEQPAHVRPGTLGATAAYFIAVFTTLAGIMCAMTGGYNSFRAAGAMTILMLARSALFRTTEVISPLLGGLSAGMLFVIGMTAHPSFVEMLHIGEARIPAAFFCVYMIIASVLSQVRDSAKPREAPAGEELSSETASRLLEMRDDAVDRSVIWFGGGALLLVPLALAWVMPWRWLSWTFLVFLTLSILSKLIPVLVYRTRKDLVNFIESVYRGSALLNAGGVASLGDYRMREVYEGWFIPMPGRDELLAVAIIALLAAPAWLLRRAAPVD
jgi:hypothetical protein